MTIKLPELQNRVYEKGKLFLEKHFSHKRKTVLSVGPQICQRTACRHSSFRDVIFSRADVFKWTTHLKLTVKTNLTSSSSTQAQLQLHSYG